VPDENTVDAGRAGERRRARSERIEQTSVGLTLAIIMTAAFVQLIDVSIVNVAIPSIQRELHASSAAIQLVVAGYLLAFAMTLITGARLGDIFGRKRLFLIGMVGFTAASAACGAAPSATALVAARVVQGAFSALMYPQVLSVIQVSIPPRERGRAFGILGAVIGLATILGPVVGGVLISANIAGTTWRSIFYVNVPIGIIAVVGAVSRLPESKAPDAPRLDVPGAVLATTAVFLLIYPLVQGRQDGWPVWGWAMLGSAVPVFAVFWRYEQWRSAADRHPLVHASLVRDRAFVSGSLLVFVFFAGLPALFFTMSQYLQLGYGFSALVTGLTVFPFAAGNIVSSIASNRVTTALGTRILTLGAAIVILGIAGVLVVVHAVGTDLAAVELTGVLVVGGFGLGFFLPPVTNLVLAGIQSRAAGAASGVLATVQQVGGSLGVALIGVVFYGVLGSFAPHAAGIEATALRAELTAIGVPAGQVSSVVDGFEACFVDRARSHDPSAVPASCRRATAEERHLGVPVATAGQVRAATARAVQRSLALDFRRAFEWALVYELGVFVTAGLFTFALPAVGSRPAGAPSPAPNPVPDPDPAGAAP
jgi:EmrB/QacA subfamily drug resistance transporter